MYLPAGYLCLMPDFFSIKSIFFTALGYPMSYLEFFGVVVGSVSVWLSARAHVWSWPLGLVGVALLFFLFYQVQLYPDMLLQVFFFATNIIGWWQWTHPAPAEADRRQELRITSTAWRVLVMSAAAVMVATVVLGTAAARLHQWLPLVFSQPSAFPYLDSFTSVLSVWATFLLMSKKLACWFVWLLTDVVLTYLYFIKGIKFLGLEYAVFCLIAAYGAWHWWREFHSYRQLSEPNRVQAA
jgi:nicotinamide mononucleotide transporter